jgi:hypothetical protein
MGRVHIAPLELQIVEELALVDVEVTHHVGEVLEERQLRTAPWRREGARQQLLLSGLVEEAQGE